VNGSPSAAPNTSARPPNCETEGIAFIPWLPIAGGDHSTSQLLTELATETGATPSQLSLASLLHCSPVMVPIPGTSSETHLIENAQAAELQLTNAHLNRLGAVR
jgi:pyridoxine 4-dehydrogenase